MVFMFIMYGGRLAKERYFIALAKSRIEKISMLLLSTLSKFKMKILKSWVILYLN